MSNIKEIILHAMQKDAIGVKSAVENELNLRISDAMDALRTDVSSELFGDDHEFNEDVELDEEDLDESWGVFMKGGSIGDQNHSGKPAKIFANEIDAKEHASRLNKNLSPGEKKFYGIKYIVKAIKEDVDLDEEDLDELSKKTLGSYVKKAADDATSIQRSITRQGIDSPEYKDLSRMRKNRKTGIGKAVDKLTKEDVEDLEEISKKTLGSYIKKSADDVTSIQRSITRQGIDSPEYKDLSRMRKNRKTGINTAVDKLTKEEVEDLEELSVDKVDAYRQASHKDKKPRYAGRQLAFAKVTGRAKVNATPSKKDEK
jgi:hypothetical protein